MDLILWRHADAQIGPPDLARELTEAGRKQAARVAGWLTPRLPPDIRILSSPALRAVQTAQALGRHYDIVPTLAPDTDCETALAASGWPTDHRPVMLVGHQPTLGQIALFLLTGQAGDLAVQKAGVWWFQTRSGASGGIAVLRAVAAPDWL